MGFNSSSKILTHLYRELFNVSSETYFNFKVALNQEIGTCFICKTCFFGCDLLNGVVFYTMCILDLCGERSGIISPCVCFNTFVYESECVCVI